MSTKINWNEETTAALLAHVTEGVEVTQDQVAQIAEELGTTARSVGAKLRKLGHSVQKATSRPSMWTPEQEAALRAFVEGNPNAYTYKEIAAQFEGGQFTDKQVQGKILSLELFHLVRKAEKKVTPRTYSADEEARFVQMANEGASMEALVEAFGKSMASIRGKALSLLRSEEISAMPKQEVSKAKEAVDAIAQLDNIAEMTVEDIAEATGKSVRGVKSILSRRGISCANYDGAARREKLDAKSE